MIRTPEQERHRRSCKSAGRNSKENGLSQTGRLLRSSEHSSSWSSDQRSPAPDVRVCVKEHNPTTGHRAADLVEAVLAACPGAKAFQFQSFNRSPAGGLCDSELVLGGLVRVGRQTHSLTQPLLHSLDHHTIHPLAHFLCRPQHPQPHRAEWMLLCVCYHCNHPLSAESDLVVHLMSVCKLQTRFMSMVKLLLLSLTQVAARP